MATKWSRRRFPSGAARAAACATACSRSEEHTSEIQSLMRISYGVFCLTKKNIFYPNYSFFLFPIFVSLHFSFLYPTSPYTSSFFTYLLSVFLFFIYFLFFSFTSHYLFFFLFFFFFVFFSFSSLC